MAGTERKKGWEEEGVKKERRELDIHTFLIHWHQLCSFHSTLVYHRAVQF